MNAVPVTCVSLEQQRVTKNAVREALKTGDVVVCDTMAGDHSILLTGIDGEWVDVFDCWWANIRTKPYKKEGRFERISDDHYCNGIVHMDELFRKTYLSTKHTPFSMGAVSSRFIVMISRD